MQRTLFSQISQKITDSILGEDARESGQFSIGGNLVNFHRENGQIIIDVSDTSTGEKTTIEMPVPQY